MEDTNTELRRGAVFAFGAYGIWGIAPLYFKSIAQVPALEIVCHRIIWSVFFLALLLVVGGHGSQLRQVFSQKKVLLCLLITSVIVGTNWLTFIWAVNNKHLMDASLGYFINPLVNVLLGLLFLREKLAPLQWFAVVLAAIGVGVQLVEFGSIPVIALFLALSFGTYGLLRKKMKVDAQVGLFIETLTLLIPAAVYLFVFAQSPTASLANNTVLLNCLLFAAGPVTAIPLLLFTAAAVRLRLSTLGFFQYIAPSLMFLIALFIFHEPFQLETGFTFAFIWLALAVFSLDAIRRGHGKKMA